ncbi:isochorismatase family protein [Endozoicomonas arenosclerae]|uniref:isochorismatase family protein n=1 Tax=Endozoicomonas arenosclerae TaxID=1633495 RepID=UPI00078046C4|nr:isochorismatase family protein [Endozoicomonas arenosclerae]
MINIGPKNTVAAFDVDAQNCFTPLCPDELPVPDGHEITDALNSQAKLARFRLGSKDAHPENAIWAASEENPQLSPVVGFENSDLHWNIHAVPGTYGFELLEGLPAVTEYDFFVWKGIEPDIHPYGACFHDHAEKRSTGVVEFLKSRQVKTVVVGGLALDYCVKVTVLQLLQSGFNVIVNLAATRTLSSDTGLEAQKVMKEAGAAFVNSCKEIQVMDEPCPSKWSH